MENKKNKFLKGALVLAGANLIVKIIGAFFKVPLYRLIGPDGNGIFSVAYQIYTFMFIIATAGFPIAVSKMVAESTAKGDDYDAKRVFQTAALLLGIIGLAGSAVLYVFADRLAVLIGNEQSATCIRVIAPAVFFVSLVSAYRGFFQGKQNMFPTAGSEVVEAGAKLIIGIIAASLFVGMAVNPALGGEFDFSLNEIKSAKIQTVYSATGAIFGVTAGTFLALLLMVIIYVCTSRKNKVVPVRELRSRFSIMKSLIRIAIPITIGASVSSLTSLVDLGTIMNRLVINPGVFDGYSHLFADGTDFAKNMVSEGWKGLELLQQKANTLYGVYTGQAQTMFNLPLTIVVGLSMSIVPAISASLAQKRLGDAHSMTASVLRITMLFALPCAVGFYVLSEPILHILYADADASFLLQKLAFAVTFVALVSVTNSVLQAYGKVYYPVMNMLVGGVVKVLMNYTLIPVWGIDAAPVATTACYAIIALLNLVCMGKLLKIKISLADLFIKPLCAALVMGAAVIFIHKSFGDVLSGTIGTFVIIGFGAVVYLVAALIVRAIKKEDVLNMPKGEKLASIMTRFKLL